MAVTVVTSVAVSSVGVSVVAVAASAAVVAALAAGTAVARAAVVAAVAGGAADALAVVVVAVAGLAAAGTLTVPAAARRCVLRTDSLSLSRAPVRAGAGQWRTSAPRAAAVLATLSGLAVGLVPHPAAAAATSPGSPWQWPLAPAPAVVRPFAPGPTPYSPGHYGADLAAAEGEVVLAAGGGEVTYAGLVAGRGVVVVSHGRLRTTYEPVVAAVRVGDRVLAGARLGEVGTGHPCPAASCLHWGLRRGDTYLDPVLLVHGPVRLLPADGAPALRLAEDDTRRRLRAAPAPLELRGAVAGLDSAYTVAGPRSTQAAAGLQVTAGAAGIDAADAVAGLRGADADAGLQSNDVDAGGRGADADAKLRGTDVGAGVRGAGARAGLRSADADADDTAGRPIGPSASRVPLALPGPATADREAPAGARPPEAALGHSPDRLPPSVRLAGVRGSAGLGPGEVAAGVGAALGLLAGLVLLGSRPTRSPSGGGAARPASAARVDDDDGLVPAARGAAGLVWHDCCPHPCCPGTASTDVPPEARSWGAKEAGPPWADDDDGARTATVVHLDAVRLRRGSS